LIFMKRLQVVRSYPPNIVPGVFYKHGIVVWRLERSKGKSFCLNWICSCAKMVSASRKDDEYWQRKKYILISVLLGRSVCVDISEVTQCHIAYANVVAHEIELQRRQAKEQCINFGVQLEGTGGSSNNLIKTD
jgi:hypothetical protein